MALTASTSNAGFLGNCAKWWRRNVQTQWSWLATCSTYQCRRQRLSVYAEGLLAIHAAVPEMVIVIVAGNHDSASRLEIYRNLWRSHNVFVIGTLRRLADNSADYSAHVVPVPGKGYIAAVPYVYPHNFPPADGDRQQAFFQGLRRLWVK